MADKRDVCVIAAYAVAHLPGALQPEFEVFDRATIDRYRGYSRGGNIWQSHFVEMAKKAVLGQLLKRLPKAVGAPDIPAEIPQAWVEGLEGLGFDSDHYGVDASTGEIQEQEVPSNGAPVQDEPPKSRQRRQPAQQPPEIDEASDAAHFGERVQDSSPASEPAPVAEDYDPDEAPF